MPLAARNQAHVAFRLARKAMWFERIVVTAFRRVHVSSTQTDVSISFLLDTLFIIGSSFSESPVHWGISIYKKPCRTKILLPGKVVKNKKRYAIINCGYESGEKSTARVPPQTVHNKDRRSIKGAEAITTRKRGFH